MAIRPIVLYPDPVLLRPTRRVETFDESVRQLIEDMADTMYEAPGVGLAANQVGATDRICIVDPSAGEKPDELLVFVNPVIVEAAGSQRGEEGCLSFPDITLDVDRAETITVEAQDADGKPFTFHAEGFLARVLLHECEHLDGKVFLRNVSSLKRELIKKQIRKRIDSGDWLVAEAG